MPIKVKNGVPTVISIGGQVYIWQSPDQYKGGARRNDASRNHSTLR